MLPGKNYQFRKTVLIFKESFQTTFGYNLALTAIYFYNF